MTAPPAAVLEPTRSIPRSLLALLSALAVTLSLMPALPAVAVEASTNVWINEFHYDNASTDQGEFVEIALSEGTDLTGWSLVLYNGNGGAVYGAVSLADAVVTGPTSGVSFAVLEISGIQNGAPDGFALVDASDAVVQFLSYEGVFTAEGGPADGLTSTDVGVEEGSSTLIGESLQLTGTGSSYADFTWAGPAAETPGAANTGQTLVPVGDPGPPANEPVVPVCADLNVNRGESGVISLSASDADGVVVAAAISSEQVAGIGLANETPATEVGGQYTVDLVAADTLGAREYDVVVTFSNDDGAAQTATCTVEIDVFLVLPDDVCEVDPVELTPISEIQGNGTATPINGEFVGTRGVVTADFTSGGASGIPNNQGLRGFFIEAITADRDNDTATSEGLFVFDFGGEFDGEIGDLVYVAGTAGEFFGVTQLSSGNVAVCAGAGLDTTLPDSADLPLPTPTDDRDSVFETIESMRVTHPELSVVEFFQVERFGQVRLSSGGVLQNPTNVVDPADDAAYNALVEFNAANTIILDDGRTGQNLDPLPYVAEGDTLRIGDQAINQTFVMHFGFGDWRLQPVDIDELTAAFRTNRTRPRPETPPEVGGSLTVGAFNVLNYFNGDGFFVGDDDASAEGFPNARGAVTPSEFERQTEKLVDAIIRMDADILGLIEIENDAGEDQAAAALVDAVNTQAGAEPYDYVDTGVIGTDAIKLAFIYKPSTVEPSGDFAILDSDVDERFDDSRNRPVLAQTFTELATGESVTVANNHLKSKGSSCGSGDDDPRQASCNRTRIRAAAAMVDWLDADPTGQDAVGSMIIGDLNSYAKEDPIAVLLDGGYTDLLDEFADGSVPYTYTFDATQGYLDYALADEELLPFVTDAAAWNINADEVPAIDYLESVGGVDFNRRFRTADVAERFYDPSAFRSSDHDPVLVGLQLVPETPDAPSVISDCFKGGWQTFTDPSFRNQGQCVSFVASGELRGTSVNDDAPVAGPDDEDEKGNNGKGKNGPGNSSRGGLTR